MGLTESGPIWICETSHFFNGEIGPTSQSVYRCALLRVDIKIDYLTNGLKMKS